VVEPLQEPVVESLQEPVVEPLQEPVVSILKEETIESVIETIECVIAAIENQEETQVVVEVDVKCGCFGLAKSFFYNNKQYAKKSGELCS
jgi:hypothetical protein